MAVLLILTVSAVAGVLVGRLLTPPPADAAAELRSFADYPFAAAVSITNNTRYGQASEIWRFDSGSVIATASERSLDVAVARMTFEVSDDPGNVLQFYHDQAERRQYYKVKSSVSDRQYLRYVAFPGWIAAPIGVLRGYDIDRPVTFYQLDVRATGMNTQAGSQLPLTRVSVELTILSETGGLR